MNIFKEMLLSVYSFESYSKFLKNKKGKVFGFGVVLMFIYFMVTAGFPFVKAQITTGGIAAVLEDNIPDFELSNGYLCVDDVMEYDANGVYIYIDTNPEYVFYDADVMEEYLYSYSQAMIVDSEKMILKSNGQVQGVYFSDLNWEFSKEDLIGWVPFIYIFILAVMVIAYLWMTALFFFGVLLVALIGMIVTSCMKYQLTFGQLYLLGIYSRTLPLIIKAVLSFMPFKIPFFFIINFGISVFIIIRAIQKMKEQNLQKPMEFTSDGGSGMDSNSNNNDFSWMQ